MKKLYIDIECCHDSGIIRKNEKWKFYDYKGWNLKRGCVIGVLGLGIDSGKTMRKELIFKQFFGWDEKSWKGQVEELFGLLNRADMIVTFNGRNFDIPCILENFVENENFKIKLLHDIVGDKGKDRDLMDIYILKRGPWIRGGLPTVAKNLGINLNNDDTDIGKECRIFLDWKGDDETECNKSILQNVLRKNENDIRVLPLIEERMGLFWHGRKDVDLFHKIWDTSKSKEIPVYA